ncbi:MAG: hypothetical protein QM775_18800 [Pirellulales bacterium]
MSWIQVGCPRCPTMVTVPAAMSGQMVVCPACGLTYQVPQLQAPPPPPPAYANPPLAPAVYAPVPQAPAAWNVPSPPQPMPAADYPPLLPPGPTAAAAPAVNHDTPPPPASPTLRPLEVLAAPKSGGANQPDSAKPKWQHEMRTSPPPSRTPQAEDSPTAALPPAVTVQMKEAIAAAAPSKAEPRENADARRRAETAPKDERVFPGNPTTPSGRSPAAGPVSAMARDELSAVDVRLEQARQKTRVTIAVAAFGIVMMMLFAWFVVNLSRPQ